MDIRCLLLVVTLLNASCTDGPDLPDPLAPRIGYVSAQAVFGWSMAARFVDNSGRRYIDEPSERTEGACTLIRATMDRASPPGRSVSVGDVTASGLAGCTSAISDGQYACSLPGADAFWDPVAGGVVRFSASGDELPGFDITVDAPRAPEEPLNLGIVGSPATDFDVRWTGGEGTFAVVAGASTAMDDAGNYRFFSLECEVPAEAEAITVPRSMLAEIQAYDSTSSLVLNFVMRNRAHIDVGGYETVAVARIFLGTAPINR